ncbi:DNA replication licensing factor MCM7 [Fistulifera solaris]|uniref:DNA replication licensing factor MCM7 n=1 Tax=Fistulifera solaris TaxID=1519565 RepID=A0A1Z5KG62_FISSO|nr:DNA replication licensing factor MCM7 [Fistulifera solaris]|eukprot:GAX25061.1 DNA replication licensing factor MCM7 [Fistulifera solaris]
MAEAVSIGLSPQYDKDEETFLRFLREHTIVQRQTHGTIVDIDRNHEDDEDTMMVPTLEEDDDIRRVPCYLPHLQRIQDRHFYEETGNHAFVIEVPLDELDAWDSVKGKELATKAAQNTVRYLELFAKVVDTLLSTLTSHRDAQTRDAIDILHDQRLQVVQQNQQQQQQQEENNPYQPNNNNNIENENLQEELQQRPDHGVTEEFPPTLMRRYEIRILPRGRNGTLPPFAQQVVPKDRTATATANSLREIRSHAMGHLVTVQGLIVRASHVQPSVAVATYSCDACGAEIYQVVQNAREFMPAVRCPSCKSKHETLHLQTRGSKFVKYQELKLQELPQQVPMGHVPRSMSVYCHGELTRLAQPGNVVTMDGIFLPQRIAESGYRALKAGGPSFDEEMEEQIQEIAQSPDPVSLLASQIAPEIFGLEDIKRALLLQLVGGCTRKLPDGMRIRGDIHICLVGDPGVAKSQLMKHVVQSLAPRSVYTTGKGSSGVGLTAAITRDLSNELALEGGALVLADRGICGIDEFDKMDEADRTAIHEVMEQQTVSIAKAGIVATLNARTAVLAAANPLYGRYHRKKSLSENINLPNSLISRFDLVFLLLDVANIDRDTALARHVTSVHQNCGVNVSDEEEEEKKTIPPHVLREYIARARQHQPVMPPEVAPYVVEAYVTLRQENHRSQKTSNDQTAMTARQLLSILRLSQALARLRFSDYVAREDVDEAIRITNQSKASISDDGDNTRRTSDVTSRIFGIIKDYASQVDSNVIDFKLWEAMALRKGFTTQQLQATLEEYESLNLIHINDSRTQVTIF